MPAVQYGVPIMEGDSEEDSDEEYASDGEGQLLFSAAVDTAVPACWVRLGYGAGRKAAKRHMRETLLSQQQTRLCQCRTSSRCRGER